MGQRGIPTLYMGGINYYWQNFYFINFRNYNWFFQNQWLKMFCTYFFVWIVYTSKFLMKFITNKDIIIFQLNYYYKFYKLRVKKIQLTFIWFFQNIIFRYDRWLLIYIEYYHQKKNVGIKTKSFKKLRTLLID